MGPDEQSTGATQPAARRTSNDADIATDQQRDQTIRPTYAKAFAGRSVAALALRIGLATAYCLGLPLALWSLAGDGLGLAVGIAAVIPLAFYVHVLVRTLFEYDTPESLHVGDQIELRLRNSVITARKDEVTLHNTILASVAGVPGHVLRFSNRGRFIFLPNSFPGSAEMLSHLSSSRRPERANSPG